MDTTQDTTTAWNCPHCHATNVGPRCGCAASRKERGFVLSTISVDDIPLPGLTPAGKRVR